MKSTKSNVVAVNYNNVQQQSNAHIIMSPKFNNYIMMNQDTATLYKFNKMNNTPACPKHNNVNLFDSVIKHNNNNNNNNNSNSSHTKMNALKKNNFNKNNVYDNNNKFQSSLISVHLNNKLQTKHDSAKMLNTHNLLTPQHNNNNNSNSNNHHYNYQRFSPNKSNEINLNNIIISLNTELTNTNNNSNIILNNNTNNNTNYNEVLKEKDKQIAKLQNELIHSQNIISKLKQEKKKMKSTFSIPNILHSYQDNELSPFTNPLHKKMLTATKSVNSLINTNSNYKSKRSTNCSFGSYESNTLNTPKESKRITISPTNKVSSTLNIGAYRSNNMNCTGRRFYSGSLNKHLYIDRERNLLVINNHKLLKLKQRNLKSITNLKTYVKKKSSSSEINGTASLTGTATMTRALSLKSGEYDSISDTNNLNITCDNLLKRMKGVLNQYWRIIKSKP